MEDKKYELLKDDTIKIGEITLYRIKALKDFNNVSAGDIGGYIEKEENLSHNGDCWVYHDAKVYQNSEVSDDACIFNTAKIYGNAKVFGSAEVNDESEVFGCASVYHDACINDSAKIHGYCEICGSACIYNSAEIKGFSLIFGEASIYDYVIVYGRARIYGNAHIHDYVKVYGNANIFGETNIYDNCEISGDVDLVAEIISGSALIRSDNDYVVAYNLFKYDERNISFFKSADGGISYSSYLNEGSLNDFKEYVKESYGKLNYFFNYRPIIKAIERKLGLKLYMV